MTEHESIAAALVHLEYLRKAADETNEHLTRVNGRLGAVETRAAILEDRANAAKNSGRNWGAGAGAVGGAIGGFFAALLKGGGQ